MLNSLERNEETDDLLLCIEQTIVGALDVKYAR